MKRICIFIIVLLWAYSLFAGNPSCPGDSVGLREVSGKPFIVYRISAGETVFSVCRKYAIPFEDMLDANPGVDMNRIRAGQAILIPAVSTAAQPNTQEGEKAVTHVVMAGETVYSIAAKYQVPLADLMQANSQIGGDYAIRAGETLRIPQSAKAPQQDAPQEQQKSNTDSAAHEIATISNVSVSVTDGDTGIPADAEATIPEENTTTESSTSGSGPMISAAHKKFPEIFGDYPYENMQPGTENGVATWIDGSAGFPTTDDRYYALNNEAPLGSIIKIRNLMNNRIIYAKVIGTLTDSDVQDKVLVKLSAGAGERLNVLDDRFVVEITYYAPAKENR